MNARHVPALLTLAAASVLAAPAAQSQQRLGCMWTRLRSSPIPRFEAGTLPIDGKLYCFGGFYTPAIEATARADVYDPQTNTWSQIADLPSPTTHIGVVREGRNVWMIGGFVGDNPGPATAEVWVYDIDADQWSPGPALPTPVAGGGAAVIGRNLHYFGGVLADRDTNTGEHWVLDLDAQQLGWQPLAPMPEPRCHLSGAALNGLIWAVGGQYRHDTNPLDTRWVHVYDPLTDVWTEGPLLPEARSHFEPGTFVRNGNLYVAAGKDLTRDLDGLSTMLELDPVLGVWTYTPPLPFIRYGAGVQPIGDTLYATNGAARFNFPRTETYGRPFDAQLPDPLRINCGGLEVVASTGTCCWCGDIGATSGNVRFFDPSVEVGGTDDDDVFRRQRQGFFPEMRDVDYRLPLGDGFYRVTFHLAELEFSAPGQRSLDLTIEGTRFAQNVDVVAEVGFETATSYTYDVEVTDDLLDVRVHAGSGQTGLLAALEIERLGSGHFEFECTSAPNSTGSASTIGFLGSTSVALDELELSMSSVPTNTFGLFIQAELPGAFPLPGGTLCVQQPFFRLPIEQAQGNLVRHDLSIANPPTAIQQIVAGSTWRFQGWYRDAVVPARYGLTDAVKLVFTP